MTTPPEQSEALLSLAERVEWGEGDMRNLLVEAFDAVHPRQLPSRIVIRWNPLYLRFQKLIAAEAWLDAAATLVPEGWVIALTVFSDSATVMLIDDRINPVRLPDVEGNAATPAAALTSATLRSLALQTGGELGHAQHHEAR